MGSVLTFEDIRALLSYLSSIDKNLLYLLSNSEKKLKVEQERKDIEEARLDIERKILAQMEILAENSKKG